MSAPAAISATFHDFRTVKGRKMCQLVFEVPIEQADQALAVLGGVPRPSDPKWVAIARLSEKAAHEAPRAADAHSERRKWDALSPAQQAAIRCAEAEFQMWLGVTDAERAADAVRQHCGVASRKELNTDAGAAERWRRMNNRFLLRPKEAA